MKKILAIFLFLSTIPLLAVDDGQVKYLGGTVPALKPNTLGKLDFTSESALQFQSSGGNFGIAYKTIDAFQPSDELTHHLGVLPAIAVGLTRTRKHRHFFRIVYHNENNVSQIVLFEVPKQMPALLQAVLKARVERVCAVEPDGKQLPAEHSTELGNCKSLAQFLTDGH